jgi:hypothetical protein
MSRKVGCRVIHDARGIERSLMRRSDGGDEEVGATNSTRCVTGVYVPRSKHEDIDAGVARDLVDARIRVYVWET